MTLWYLIFLSYFRMASSTWAWYQRLRYIDVLGHDDQYEWDILVAEGYEPFQGTLYGLSLWHLAGRVAQGISRTKYMINCLSL